MTCPPNAVPHILARPFNGIGDSDPDEGFDIANDFQPDDSDFTVFNICDNTTLVKCQPCGALPQAYHAFHSFRVFENTNAPFQPRAEPYIVDIIKCSDFDGFTLFPGSYTDAQPILFQICQYASAQGLPPFVVKIMNPTTIPIFNFPTQCSNIPSTPLATDSSFTLFFNGLNCGITGDGPDNSQVRQVTECLNNFDFNSVTSAFEFVSFANTLCMTVGMNCPGLENPIIPLTINLCDNSGVDLALPNLLQLAAGCDVNPSMTNFVVGQTYQLKINDGLFKIFTVTS